MINKIESDESVSLKSSAQPASEEEEGHCFVQETLPRHAPQIQEERAVKRVASISVKDFKQEFFKKDLPVIITGVMDGWPALRLWRDLRYLRDKFGHRTVPVELGRIAGGQKLDGWREEAMLMERLISEYLIPSNIACLKEQSMDDKDVAYLAQHALFDQLTQLQKDFEVPEYCECGAVEGMNAWLGTAGTVTPLHHDSADNILAQAVGYKYIRLYHPQETRNLYVNKSGRQSLALTVPGQVNCEFPDFDRFPLLQQANYEEAILRPGDMLFIPSKHWHYVRSLTPSFSVNFWF
ncbi:hypothetical protein GUITHDRAFT_72601 [Guillardia theta CCMP2712]|uniref:JmjC domain-containing protein n=1 Tax=Guillardia theta (strain CCMP2712) TaxID=905079 RepID=L1J7C5_GUITC|nr:hypothetical protein GUITHDRAFT_72601 [Guillardia theta CCMP2712]EKX43980.1 hypothetical protein GUITHDRAFT_72601 [Guillardia theta CCMP2712]|eukprot:XP_005830960.1 hypothetical protein GUITHDRAFT_72601 [Guillardia theta CCMP2712]